MGRSGGGAGKKDRPGEPCSQAIKISRLNHSHENERIFERLITDFFSTLVNVTQSTSDKGYLCATDKEGFSTGKRCFLVSFTDGVGEKERNSTKISRLNLQGLFYLLARRFYILLFLYLSITAWSFSLKAYFSKALYVVVRWSLIIGLHTECVGCTCQEKRATKLMLR